MKYCASDNNAGTHPKVLEALAKSSEGNVSSYGNDRWTEEARELFCDAFGRDTKTFFVFTGTAANVLALKHILRSYECIVCPDTSHLHTDECGSTEAVTGSKLIRLPSVEGRLNVKDLPPVLEMRDTVHSPFPKLVSVAQLTECITQYTVDELMGIKQFCKQNGFYFHMDGARLVNAAAAEGVTLKTFTSEVGVDVLSFGGTKNGLLFGEAIVFLNPELAIQFELVQKQYMQLASKMRFIAAQFSAYFTDELWRKNAAHANAMAKLLELELSGMPHVSITYSVNGNAIFARMPKKCIARLHKEYYFYIIDPFDTPGYPEDWPLVRFMTSFSTTHEEVLDLARAIGECHL